ncbi:MAG: prepilin-type N-terminal cleavage/methylation domain-containing protein [Candidatus Pacebacteria bacterium]|nr:prepilin-type N-terminal cleavage/methylation domain-containing protein [Candidatus Paceibacterota bacterium]
MNNNQKSFTLLELLVVIAIIAILAGVVIASVVDLRQRARESKGMQFSQNIKSTSSVDLTSEWKFNEGSGTTVKDSSGNDITGTITNATWVDGKLDEALNFSADESKLIIPANPIFNPSSEITIEAWIKSNSTTRQQIITEAYGYCCHSDKHFFIQSNRLYYYARAIGTGGHAYSSQDPNLSSNKWNHVVIAAKTNERPKFYVNGELRDDPTSTQTYSPVGMHSGLYLTIGSSYNGTGNQVYEFQGNIDELRTYKSSFTAKEVQKLYTEGEGRHVATNGK